MFSWTKTLWRIERESFVLKLCLGYSFVDGILGIELFTRHEVLYSGEASLFYSSAHEVELCS